MNSVGSVMSAIETATTDAAAIVAPSGQLTLQARNITIGNPSRLTLAALK